MTLRVPRVVACSNPKSSLPVWLMVGGGVLVPRWRLTMGQPITGNRPSVDTEGRSVMS